MLTRAPERFLKSKKKNVKNLVLLTHPTKERHMRTFTYLYNLYDACDSNNRSAGDLTCANASISTGMVALNSKV